MYFLVGQIHHIYPKKSLKYMFMLYFKNFFFIILTWFNEMNTFENWNDTENISLKFH